MNDEDEILNEDENTEPVENTENTEDSVEPPTHEEEILNAANQVVDTVPAKVIPKPEDVSSFIQLTSDLEGAQMPNGVVLKSDGALVFVPDIKITPDVNQPAPGLRSLVKV